ncbi:cell division protein ZapA [Desulfonatronum thioautotrophicum]|uniref:cell division protein ZapA n=1 Tax=Desulfonatronum thioautotrophicum TaxID=617001 RepID=UPI0005EB8276|nr:cell division protein ZapA [Desulfonatronum thioautotrophicum]
MPSHTISVLGLDLAFKADAEHAQVVAARKEIEERYAMLRAQGKHMSREKLLAFLALGLADDYLLTCKKLGQLETKLEKLLHRMEQDDTPGNDIEPQSE